jgi:formylglycine-generating enzyme required for sulfatase activity
MTTLSSLTLGVLNRDSSQRSLWQPYGPMLLLWFVLGAACEEKQSQPCPTVPDQASVVDHSVGKDAAVPEASFPLCQKDKVQCKADEINAFGSCLPSSSMVKVSEGEFTMGRQDSGKDHAPEHKVTLKEYLIDKTEVPAGLYQACVECGVCKAPLRDGSHTGREPYYGNTAFKDFPVIYVGWNDAKTYCEAIGKRLPTEAEWEKAARGANGAEYPWGGDAPNEDLANFLGVANDTLAVGDREKGKSAYGALNLAGNVWEWVSDSYDPGYYGKSPKNDPPGPASSSMKVMRGGGFLSTADQIKTFIRAAESESSAYSYLGFRCAKGPGGN